MICNIPCRFSYEEIVQAIHSVGFAGLYDFVHVPGNFRSHSGNIGYAFAHFTNPEVAAEFAEAFHNYQFEGTKSTKRCAVKPAHLQAFNGYNALKTHESKG